ncbi:hypothetical protein GGC64_006249 [Mycobacterium sp. OAS707]|nr:hypothetical protein [Mycobacterium sp. OAS707]MBE1552162.1 hypothetical protein [Mycobacterium sp. OAS707]
MIEPRGRWGLRVTESLLLDGQPDRRPDLTMADDDWHWEGPG